MGTQAGKGIGYKINHEELLPLSQCIKLHLLKTIFFFFNSGVEPYNLITNQQLLYYPITPKSLIAGTQNIEQGEIKAEM